MLTLIPEEKFFDCVDYKARYNGYCSCGKYLKNLRGYLYGYDEENDDVYWIYRCPHCSETFIIKE